MTFLNQILLLIERTAHILLTFYGGYVDRPIVHGLTAVLGILVAVWVASKAIRGLGRLLGGTVVPASGLVDQGKEVDRTVEDLSQKMTSLVGQLFEGLENEYRESYAKQVDALSTELTKTRSQLEEVFNKDFERDRLRARITSQEDQTGELILSAYRRLSARTKRGAALEPLRDRLNSSLQRLLDSAPKEFLVLQTGENLAFEPDDSLTVKIAKVIRRAQRSVERRIAWLSLRIGRNGGPKLTTVRRIEWKALLKARLQHDLQVVLGEWFRKVEVHLSKIQIALKESARVVQFNLESAAAELANEELNEQPDKAIDSAKQTTLGSFDRVLARFQAVLDESEAEWEKLKSDLTEKVPVLINKIHRDSDVADTVGAIATAKLEQGTRALKDHRDSARKRLRIILGFLARSWISAVGTLTRASTKLGLKTAATHEWVGALDNATIEFAQRNLPPLYKRVFRFDPLGDEEFFVSRDESLAKIEHAGERWAKGLSCSIGIYGPGGSGKTSLVTCAQQRLFPKEKVFSATLESPLPSVDDAVKFIAEFFQLKKTAQPKTMNDLAEAIKAEVGPAVAILEGANLLFTRSMNGFIVLESFLDLLAKTRPEILWIVTMSEEAWRYLDSVKNISGYFTYVINARNMDREDLERVIMVRHEITGYDMEFVAPDVRNDFWRRGRQKSAKDLQEELRKRFFDDLHDSTDGNLFSSIYYWLCATEFVGEEGVRIHPLKPLEMGAIRSLNHRQAACLVAALQQGILWPETYAKIFRSNLPQAAMCLTELQEKTILLQLGEKRYVPNPIVIPNATKVLRERNLIYA